MLLLTTCVLCSSILLSVCVFEIALGFCRPPHCCSWPTNGRRATLPNTNPSWDGFFSGPPTDARGRPTGGAPHSRTPTLPGMVFFPPPPLMLGPDQREARHPPEPHPFLGWFFAGLPTDARGRPTGGAPHSRTPTLPGVGFCRPTQIGRAHV